MAESFEEAGCRICRQKAGRDALPGDPSLLLRKHLFRLRLWSFSEYLHPKKPNPEEFQLAEPGNNLVLNCMDISELTDGALLWGTPGPKL